MRWKKEDKYKTGNMNTKRKHRADDKQKSIFEKIETWVQAAAAALMALANGGPLYSTVFLHCTAIASLSTTVS
jgi:hypothetical protein